MSLLRLPQAGDPVAQMSLGYRHMQGLGVPKSCQTGACSAHAYLGAAVARASCEALCRAQRRAWLLGVSHSNTAFSTRNTCCSGAVLCAGGGACAGHGSDAGRPAAGALCMLCTLWCMRERLQHGSGGRPCLGG